MNRLNHPYWRRNYWYQPWNYSSQDFFNSQYSNVAQNIYNAGYIDGVNQISNVNQYQDIRWW